MPDLGGRIRELHALENLSSGGTAIHRLHPASKILTAFVYIAVVASFGRYDFFRLAPYLFYPFVMMALAELPYGVLLPRVLIALPFCLFAGVTNAIIENTAAFTAGGVTVSFGALSLATILLKMYLCVMAALLLVATTPFTDITAQLRRLRAPVVFVISFEMTFRYIGVLLEEAYTMATAYRLRAGMRKAPDMRHMGSFAGQLLLRGFDRAERVYAAMSCRGYSMRRVPPPRQSLRVRDAVAAAAVCVPAIVARAII